MAESQQESTARKSCDEKDKIMKRSLVPKRLRLIRGKTLPDSQYTHEEMKTKYSDTANKTKENHKSLELQVEKNQNTNSTEIQKTGTVNKTEIEETKAESVTKIIAKLTESSLNKIKDGKALNCSEDLEFLYQSMRKTSSEFTSEMNLIFSAIVENKFFIVLENILSIIKEEQTIKMKPMADWYEYKKILSIAWIVSDRSTEFCNQLVRYPSLVKLLVELLKMLTVDSSFWKTQWILYTVKSILGILHNVHRHDDTAREIFRKTNLITVLQQTAKSEVDMIRAKCFIIMSYIITEEEISTLNADDQILKFLIDILVLACESVDHVSKKYGMCVTEIIQGLNNLSVNDDNKVRLVRLGIVPLYLGLLKEYRQEEVLFVVNGLWKLSFHHTNKEVMRRSGCVQVLEGLKESDDERIRHSALGALWELRQEKPNLDMTSKKDTIDRSGYRQTKILFCLFKFQN